MAKIGGKKIAIFGATGYVGLIFVNRLANVGWNLKLFVRNKRRLQYLKNYKNIESCDTKIKADNIPELSKELADCDILYYFIHSLTDSDISFEKQDCYLADVVAQSAKNANITQIIYLGGLGHEEEGHPLSIHLSSRHQVSEILRSSGTNVTDIRAGIIIGAGSASFEIIKALGAKLPFIPKLSYADGLCQPIDIDDVITYLLHVYNNPHYFNTIVEIGSSQKLTYPQMIQIYAKTVLNRNLRIIHIPGLEALLTKRILANIIAFLSAIPSSLTQPLIDGVGSIATLSDNNTKVTEAFDMPCLSYDEAVLKASLCESRGQVESFWSIPLKQQVLSRKKEKFLYIHSENERFGFLQEHRKLIVKAKDVEKIFKECLKVGGKHGYWSPKWMWGIRAFLDKLIGGTGLESGRQTREKVTRIGERIDFWIVSDYLDNKKIKIFTLKARLKSPGSSWLQFALVQRDKNEWEFLLRAYFKPDGLLGYIYWYSLWPIHKYIFTAMINNIKKEALKPSSLIPYTKE